MLADLHDLAVLSFGTGDGNGSAIALSGSRYALGTAQRPRRQDRGRGRRRRRQTGVFGAALRSRTTSCRARRRHRPRRPLRVSALLPRRRNEVLAAARRIVATGAVAPGATLDVVGNKVATSGDGIAVGPDATVDSNAVNALGTATAPDRHRRPAGRARHRRNRRRRQALRRRPGTCASQATASTTAPARDRAPHRRPTWIVKNVIRRWRRDRDRLTARPTGPRSTTTRSSTSRPRRGRGRHVRHRPRARDRVRLGRRQHRRPRRAQPPDQDPPLRDLRARLDDPRQRQRGRGSGPKASRPRGRDRVVGPFDTASVSDNTSRFTPGGTARSRDSGSRW